jgi:hypothetical protein
VQSARRSKHAGSCGFAPGQCRNFV